MVEATEADKHIILEDFTFFPGFLRLDVLSCQWMHTEYLYQARKKKGESQ